MCRPFNPTVTFIAAIVTSLKLPCIGPRGTHGFLVPVENCRYYKNIRTHPGRMNDELSTELNGVGAFHLLHIMLFTMKSKVIEEKTYFFSNLLQCFGDS